MDYDENDFEGRQPLIAGEGSSKFSSVLHPYVLPKFDFDDGFQGHLRFDSLVENDAFLGIPSQGDNQWIETFPQGSSGIEFTSSAPESCSFSRHNNVWSEAASSETVEMLLKSVGQEDIVGGETIVVKSDACDGVGLTKQMDPQLQDFQDQHVKDPGSLFLSGECQEHTKVEGTSQSQETEVSAQEGSFALNPNASSGVPELVMTEKNVGLERKSDDVTRMEVGSTVTELSDNRVQTEPSGSGMQIDEIERSDRDISTSIEGSNTGKFDHKQTSATFEKAFQASKNSGKEIEEHHVLTVEADAVDKHEQRFAVKTANHNVVNEPCSSKTHSVEQNTIEPSASENRGSIEGSNIGELDHNLTSVTLENAFQSSKNSGKEIGEHHALYEEDHALYEEDAVDEYTQGIAVETGSQNLANEPCSSKTDSIEQNTIESSARDNESIEESTTEEFDHNQTSTTYDNAFQSSKNGCKDIEEHHVVNVEVDAVETGNHNLVNEPCFSKTGSIEQNTVEAAPSDLQGVSYLALRGNLGVQMTEECSKNPYFPDAAKANEPQLVDLSDRTEVLGGLRENLQESLTLISEGNCIDHGKFIEVTTASEDTCDSSELQVDQRTDGANILSEGKDCMQGSEKLDSHASGTESEVPIISGVEDEPSYSQRDGSCSKYVSDSAPSIVTCSSTAFRGKNYTIETVEDLGGASSAVHKEDAKDENGLRQNVRGGSNPIDQLFAQDAALSEKESVMFKQNNDLDSESVESLRSNKRVGPSSERECSEVRDGSVHGHESLNTERNKPGLDVHYENTNLELLDPVDAAPSPSQIVATVDQGTNLFDQNYKSGNEGLSGANLLILKKGLGEQRGLGPMLPMVESCNWPSGCEQSVELLNKPVDQSLSMVESSNTVSGREQAYDGEKNHDSPKKLKICATACNSAVEDGGDGEGLVLQDKELDAENDVEVTSFKIAGSVKSICGKNSATDCTVLSENEKFEEEAKGSTSKSYPLSEVTAQSTQVLGEDGGSIRPLEVDPSAGLLEEETTKDGESLTPTQECRVDPSAGVLEEETTKDGESLIPTQECRPHMIAERYPLTPSHKETEILLEQSHGSQQEHNEDASTVSIKSTCGNPTVSSCTVLFGSKKNEKGSKGSTSKSSPLAEVTFQPYQTGTGNNGEKNDNSFNFKLHPSAGLSEKQASKPVQPITTKQECNPHSIEGSPKTPSASQNFSEMPVEISCRSSQAQYGEIVCGSSKDAPERKRKRALGGSSKKESSKRGNHLKNTTLLKQPKREDKSCNVPVGNPVTSQLVQLEGLKPCASVACSGVVTHAVVSASSSNLPDLNTSAPPLLFQQPFTDTQQVQLRAQIIIYGSLIQGAVPDEAFMVSAFGASDGGRSVWEPSWHASLKRVKCQKSHTDHSETPAKLLSAARSFNKSIKQDERQSKVSASPSPLGRAGSKVVASAAVNSIIPLSSPLWNISTPDVLQSRQPRSGLDYYRSVSPLHPFQTPPHCLSGYNASMQSQTSFPSPWISSAKTSVFDSSRFPVLPMEAVKLTPVKGLSSCVSRETKNASHVPDVHSISPGFLAVNTSLHDSKRTSVLSEPVSTDQKARKRKNVTVSEVPRQFSLLAHPRTESVSIPVVTCHLSTSVVVSTPDSFISKSNTNKIVTTAATASSTDHLKHGEHKNGQKVDIGVDTSNKVEESKKQAEDAAALAASALNHSHIVWSQLDKHRNSGLVADAEAKLASAAVAVAAAASVAKAAAAAAKIASNIALQAKLMADEMSQLTETSNPAQVFAASFPEVSNNLGKATPVSLLRCGDASNNTSSIIGAGKDAAKRRIEAASAVVKHAEIADAIVKAAELAAEAVTQAGKVVSMGDPLPLNELIAAGPDGYWRIPPLFPQAGVMSTSDNGLRAKAESYEGGSVPRKQAGEGSSEHRNTETCSVPPRSKEVSSDSMNDCMRNVDGASTLLTINEKKSQGKMAGKDDLAKTIGVIPESEFGSGCASRTVQEENEKGLRTLDGQGIKEGCLVEVRRDGDERKPAWFSASVLSLKGGKAFVCYTDLQADEDSGKLREWVEIEDQVTGVPRIRIAHPMIIIRFEGTRKRRRDAMENFAWSVGDRVDVWTQSCWREAIVTEKNREDETSLTVHFQAGGATSVVKVWHLRPTLLWKNVQWIRWSISKEKDPSYQGDTPTEKRKKLGVPALKGVENDKTSKIIELKDSLKPDGMCLLPLSAKEKIFSAGKYVVDQHRPTVRGALRTGLKKEGSGVVFGVPKPGSKQKFMDVSKHYVAERNSTSIKSNDSVKFAKCLMPQGGGWRNQTRPVTKMNREKLAQCRNVSVAEVKKKLNNADPGSLTSELSEPRRSNRRIKPTSRLLEGIQSSLMISKTPSASHDKGHRSQK